MGKRDAVWKPSVSMTDALVDIVTQLREAYKRGREDACRFIDKALDARIKAASKEGNTRLMADLRFVQCRITEVLNSDF